MSRKKKCEFCGKAFVAAEKGDRFCSGLCRTTAESMAAKRGDCFSDGKAGGKFPHVEAMFALPEHDERRWEIAKHFTEEERKYALMLQRRKEREEQYYYAMDGVGGMVDFGDEEETAGDGDIGASDDGTV